ncbi:MAG: hypothetical protein ACK559_02420, partial [bacterium]
AGAAGARPVVDDLRLPQPRGEPCAHRARDGVREAAGAEGHHQPDRTGRIRRLRSRGRQRQSRPEGGQRGDESATRTDRGQGVGGGARGLRGCRHAVDSVSDTCKGCAVGWGWTRRGRGRSGYRARTGPGCAAVNPARRTARGRPRSSRRA